MKHDGLPLGVRAEFQGTKLSTQHQSPIGAMHLNLSMPPLMTPNGYLHT